MIDEARLVYPAEKPFLPNFVVGQAFTQAECVLIQSMMDMRQSQYATIGNTDNNSFYSDLQYRTVKTAAVPSNMNWVYARIMDHVRMANDQHFHFDLFGLTENLQYLTYEIAKDAENIPAGHYDWHQDFGGGYSALRKLSISVQLSEYRVDYDGCELQMFTNHVENIPNTEQGSICIFPSYMPHCVTPIHQGTRKALVSWISGPQFR